MRGISALIIARNEAGNIERAVKSLEGMAEVIVIDSGSSDGTAEIAGRSGARVYSTDWPGYAEQRKRALEKASGDWCLFLDADEELDSDLQRIIKSIEPETGVSGYYLRRSNHFLGRRLKHGRWANDWQLRLFLKKDAEIKKSQVHEGVMVKNRTERLMGGNIIHHTSPTLARHLEKMNLYTTLEASQKGQQGNKFSLGKMLFSPSVEFWKQYLFQGGFRDGLPGLAVASLSALYKVLVMAKMFEAGQTGRGRLS